MPHTAHHIPHTNRTPPSSWIQIMRSECVCIYMNLCESMCIIYIWIETIVFECIWIYMNISMILVIFIFNYLMYSEFIHIYTNTFWSYLEICTLPHCCCAAHCRTARQPHTATHTAGQPHTAARTAAHCCNAAHCMN
jgi:hypothetical protein